MSPLLQYSVGTLRYSRRDLIRVSGLMLAIWFVYSLFTVAFSGSIPLILEHNGANNSEIIFISVVLGSMINLVMNPVISYTSDFTRSKYGRRRPYLLLAAPAVAFFFALLAFGGEIGRGAADNRLFSAIAGYLGYSPQVLVFILIAIGYYFCFNFINTVTFYLVPDVIPKAVMARYNGLMRVANSAGGAVFNYFFLQYVVEYGKIIMPLIAVVFATVTFVAVLKIKEGDYAPTPKRGVTLLERMSFAVKDYFRTSFADRYFWAILLPFACSAISICLHSLMVFFCRDEIGMSVKEFGHVNAMMALFVLIILPLSILIDKLNHFRVFFYSWLAIGIISLLGYFTVSGYWSFFVFQMLITLAGLPTSIDGTKVSVDLFPPNRYGQLCSARAIFNSLCAITFAFIGGKLLDLLGRFTPGAGEEPGLIYSIFGHYRVIYLWRGVFMIAAALLFWRLYRLWLASRCHRRDMRRN